MSRLYRSYTAVDPCFREDGGSRQLTARSRLSQTRMEQRRPYFSSIATQTEEEIGLPTIPHNDKPTMTDFEADPYYGGSLSARPPSAPRQNGYNNYYQRVMGRQTGYPQTARPEYEPQAIERRVAKETLDVGPPTFRSGRMGASWRHVRQCLGNLGNHICFVDGAVKESDIQNYPPYGYVRPTEAHTYISPRLSQRHDNGPRNQDNRNNKYATKYNVRAKQGFEYWNVDKPKPSGAPKRTIQGRMMKLGVGY